MRKMANVRGDREYLALTFTKLPALAELEPVLPRIPPGYRRSIPETQSGDEAIAWAFSRLVRGHVARYGFPTRIPNPETTLAFETWLLRSSGRADRAFANWFAEHGSDYAVLIHRSPLDPRWGETWDLGHWSDVYDQLRRRCKVYRLHLNPEMKERACDCLNEMLYAYEVGGSRSAAEFVAQLGHRYAVSRGMVSHGHERPISESADPDE